jgi:hypothetical protein
MQFPILTLAAIAATSMIVLSSGTISSDAYAANRGDRGTHSDRRDRSERNNRSSDLLWRRHENGCAVGNTPPPGANCTNRDTQ